MKVTKLAIFENSTWRTAAILKIVSSLGPISQPRIIRFQLNLVCHCRFCDKVSKYCKFKNGGRPPYWKSSIGYISANYCPINAKFCAKKHNHVQTQVTWPKYQILKIQDGGRPPFCKWYYRYISAGNHPISMKFGVKTQIIVPRTVRCWFIKKYEIQIWRTAAILKIVFWLYLHQLFFDWRGIWYIQVEPCSAHATLRE